MSERRSRFRDSARLLQQAVEERLGDHPSVAELGAFHRGELPTARAEEIADHLTWCRADAEIVRDMDLLSQEPEEPVAPTELQAAWERFRSESAETEPELVREPVPLSTRQPTPAPRSRPPRFAYALAASAVIAAGIALLWGGAQRERADQALQPKANVPHFSLFPEGSDRSSDRTRLQVSFDRLTGAASLSLNPVDHFPQGRYRVRLTEPEGRVRWESSPLEPTDAGDFVLELARGFVPPGPYDLEVWPDGGGEVALARYRLEILSASP